jgi:hydroxymethylbilane synthase
MPHTTSFKLGTRGSPLALWQAERVQSLLWEHRPDVEIEIVIIQTIGDKILDKPMVQVGDKGIFTKEIENALLDKTIDFAVHSFKDLPTKLPEGLAIICIPERDSPFDALFSKSADCMKDFPKNPIIATGSLRRKAQILALRPDATVVDIRGNVNTRLRKYNESNWDGLIMAHAAIRRLEWEDKIAGVLKPEEMLPAPAQGALAVEARIDDEAIRVLLQTIHDANTAAAVQAERAFLAALEGGCQVPIAAYAKLHDGQVELTGLIASLNGKQCVRECVEGNREESISLGRELAERVLENGGEDIIRELLRLSYTRN